MSTKEFFTKAKSRGLNLSQAFDEFNQTLNQKNIHSVQSKDRLIKHANNIGHDVFKEGLQR